MDLLFLFQQNAKIQCNKGVEHVRIKPVLYQKAPKDPQDKCFRAGRREWRG